LIRLLADDGPPIQSMVLQYIEELPLDPYLDMARAVPDAQIIVATDTAQAALSFLEGIQAAGLGPERLALAVTGGVLSTWTRDTFQVGTTPDGAPAVLLRRRLPGILESEPDREVAKLVARHLGPKTELLEPALFVEGGNLVAAEDFLIVGSNSLADNLGLAPDRAAFQRLLALELSRRVLIVGGPEGQVPLEHLDMYVTPIGANRVLVGDPRAAVALFSECSSQALAALEARFDGGDPDFDGLSFSFGELLETNRAPSCWASFDQIADQLAREGLIVGRIPLLTTDQERELPILTANNVLQQHPSGATQSGATQSGATQSGAPEVMLPVYGIPAFDRATRAVWEAQGFVPHLIDASSIIDLQGSVRCLTQVLRRR